MNNYPDQTRAQFKSPCHQTAVMVKSYPRGTFATSPTSSTADFHFARCDCLIPLAFSSVAPGDTAKRPGISPISQVAISGL